MEPRDRPAQAVTDAKVLHRFRLTAICLVLTAFAFIQQPGRIVADTKLDLVVDPGGFLARALHMWDAQGAFGQIQNQAYGYLFPMGPFFWFGHLADVDPWVVQRLWWATIFCVAFLGVTKLAEVLEIGAPWTRILAGLAYALSPRFLTVLGPASIEIWPSAVAPWVLIPLVLAVRRNQPRRYATFSALAVASIGGVNAAATFAVVPLAVLWIVMSPRGRTRRTLMLAWPPLVLLGTLWWIVPLFLLGSYSPPFLDYIETASVTSLATDLFDVLRGTVQWVPYADPSAVSGHQLITEPVLILNSAVVMLLGFVGLLRRDVPHRAFLVSALTLGVVLVAISHVDPAGGVLASPVRSLLDGPLAALRNTHKFELVVRLPLVLGLAHVLAVVTKALGERSPRSQFRGNPLGIGVTALALSVVVGASAPAWAGNLANRGSFEGVPAYWTQASTWLGKHDQGTALLLPASGFATYAWGRATDEPMQPLARSKWAVRNLIPLAPGANIEMLDAISARLASGEGGPGLAAFLRRSGVSHLVVRNDVDRTQDLVQTEQLYSVLSSMPSTRSVASFGPAVGGDPNLTTKDGTKALVNDGWQTTHPAIEIFSLGGSLTASTQPADSLPVLIGGPQSLMTLDDLHVTDHSNTIFAPDQSLDRRPPSVILADGDRRQEDGFGSVNHNRSNSLARGDPYTVDRKVHQYDQDRIARWQSVPRMDGARRVIASSSQSDVDTLPFTRIADNPWAAFDGDTSTAWRASSLAGGTAWVELQLDGPTDLGDVRITLATPGLEAQEVTVTTDAGPKTVTMQSGVPTTVRVGRVSRLKISGASSFGSPFAVSSVSWGGTSVSRPLVMPRVPDAWGIPDRILMSDGEGYSSGCLTVDGDLRCNADQYSAGEDGRTIDREFELSSKHPGPSVFTPSLRIAPVGSAALDGLAQSGKLVTVEASSRVNPSPASSPVFAIDGLPSTGWVADPDDPDPSLTVRWLGKRSVSHVVATTSQGLPAATATRARLEFTDGSTREVRLTKGKASFAPVKADGVTIHLERPTKRDSLAYDGHVAALPVGVSELDFPDLGLLPSGSSDQVSRHRCGSGPTVEIDGAMHQTSLSASPREMLRGDALTAQVCGGAQVSLGPGQHRVTIKGNDAFRPTSLLLTRKGAADLAGTYSAANVAGDQYSAGSRPQPSMLTSSHNANRGWEATSDGHPLSGQVVNGWQQGWRTPTGATTVIEKYAPDRTYRLALAGGLVALLLLLGLALLGVIRSAPRASAPLASAQGVRLLPLALLAALGLVVSPIGVLCAAIGAIAARLLARAGGVDTSWWAVVPLGVTTVWAAVRPWASAGGWMGDQSLPQFLVAISLGALVAGVRPRLRRR